MSLENLSREDIKSMSMLELAKEILLVEKKAMDFRDIFNKIAEMKELTADQRDDLLSQFYTDINVDGRFITLGSNMWGLKRWYPVEQMDEDIQNEPKKKKKAKKKLLDEDDDLDLELDDDEIDLDLEDEVEDDIDEEEDFIDLDDEDDEDFDDIDEEEYDFDEDEDLEDEELDELDEIDEEDEEFEDEK
ncbi:DNA-directed RNA polymerase subunit delta [Ornithinibacillus bavariensis]|uniref:Probable DNA-directed RNA polymerase subunit delta n=1 Tax=Ornithinibacillus bavariensis TaxID=545502 RepID=A0A920C5K6_9BACI|nr:DNA-directed RNA polymerase subunit delta [Ornithinibacillus bavariensis]GIO26830.1 hypothetical protein J43TS3_14410 [Ornithinibacillus bavariensis]HAM80722.1 DNA-directed RNA polymerase subunit delta [Ornithinibacillus sp.]